MRSSTGTGTIATADAVPYRGRFAPSPTGPLHFGSLIAALGSYLEARAHGGTWSLRIENLDRPREVPGAASQIMATLEAFGFQWDGPVVFQQDRLAAYRAALDELQAAGLTYGCSCSRSEIEAGITEDGLAGAEIRYPGTCRLGPRHPDRPLATRFRVPPRALSFTDAIQGLVTLDVQAAVGDFVVRRRDGYFAYQLAVVVDDHELDVTAVVRGADLLDNTPRQILLQESLGFSSPTYAHLPLAVDAGGNKLSKSTQSLAIDPSRSGSLLWQALQFLEQSPPEGLRGAPAPEIWAWALPNWSVSRLKGIEKRPAPAP